MHQIPRNLESWYCALTYIMQLVLHWLSCFHRNPWAVAGEQGPRAEELQEGLLGCSLKTPL